MEDIAQSDEWSSVASFGAPKAALEKKGAERVLICQRWNSTCVILPTARTYIVDNSEAHVEHHVDCCHMLVVVVWRPFCASK
jgi:hypothetical protein